jgi:hypothetical protein
LDIELNTVDAFQGREKDIIIISTVRSNDYGSIGFLSDTRRMNVAITRAKYGLFIIGNAVTLSNHPYWRQLVEYADSLGSLLGIVNVDQELDLGRLMRPREEAHTESVLALSSSSAAAVESGDNQYLPATMPLKRKLDEIVEDGEVLDEE